jgi:glycosyltransferase involved in cell wall biosynthesis
MGMEKSDRRVKRVLMTADAVGGVWTYALELIRQYKSEEIEVALAVMGPSPDKAQREGLGAYDNVELFEGGYKLEWMEDCWEEVEEACDWLLDLETLIHPDIIHLNGYVHAALPWQAPVLVVGHSCVGSWFEHVKKCSIPQGWEKYKRKVREGLDCADYVVAPSGFMLNCLKKHYGLSENSSVIYNGRSAGGFFPGIKDEVIFTAGRLWDDAKNIRSLLSISREIPWPVHVAGEGEQVCANVKYLGKLSGKEIEAEMNRSSLFVMPALYDPFGFSVLEAGLSGCVLVLGDIPSYREIWGESALYVPSEDSSILRDTILDLTRNKDLVAEYSEKSRARAYQYTSEKMASQYIDLYCKLISKVKSETCGRGL